MIIRSRPPNPRRGGRTDVAGKNLCRPERCAHYFTRLDWARRQFIEKPGIDPFPGTINLIVEEPDSIEVWKRNWNTAGVRINNPNDGPHDCDARCNPVSIDSQIDGAIVLPEVAGYSPIQIEIIATMGVRDALDNDDGDSLRLKIR